jgi:tetratricopeptide (TPR) repeat protein/transcriptional regulator with XRE-family HTH domain
MAKAFSQDWEKRLRRERERRGWSREQLAEKIGGAAHSIYRWEDGRDKPRPYMRERLVNVFGKSEEKWGNWVGNVPYLRNLYFTGRDRILARLHTALSAHTITVVSQSRAISGLGGIGKTQTAVEYAYRYGDEYDLVLWVRADSREAILREFAGLASLFDLPNHAEADLNRLAKAVKRHLETQREQVWLLIFDNVDDLLAVKEFLPERGNGAVLLTTRLHAVGNHMRKIDLDKLSLEESMRFLLGRTYSGEDQERPALPEAERQAAEQVCRLLDGLPLALDQAAAYIEERGCSLAEYVALYEQQRTTLLTRRNQVDPEDYPESVATTWLVSFDLIEAEHPAAAELLRLCAYLAPDAIPEEMLTAGAACLGPVLAPVVANSSELNSTIEALRAYSLIQRHAAKHTFSIHRLVQAVLQDARTEDEQHLWARRALVVVNAVFPQVEPETWPQCERLVTQALQVAKLIEQHQLVMEEAGRLLFETASYLQYLGRNDDVESFYLRALDIWEQLVGPDHPQVVTTLNHLGALNRYYGNYAEAERFCQRALAICEQQVGPDHLQVANALVNPAICYVDQGRYAEAEPLHLRALHIYEQQVGPRTDDTARTLNNLAYLYREQGRYAEAEPLYLRALDIWEQQAGEPHPDRADTIHGQAQLQEAQGSCEEAVSGYKRALAEREQALGAHHPKTRQTRYHLITLLEAMGQHEQAVQLQQTQAEQEVR